MLYSHLPRETTSPQAEGSLGDTSSNLIGVFGLPHGRRLAAFQVHQRWAPTPSPSPCPLASLLRQSLVSLGVSA
jgi:hypothetical protein